MEQFKQTIDLVHEKLMRLRYHDLQEGLIMYDQATDKYYPAVKWNLFGYTQEEIFEGLEDIFNE